MRYITLTEEERATLEQCYRHHNKHHIRQRCHSLLLSNGGMQAKEIAALFSVRTRTIYFWLDRWEQMGLSGLWIQPGRGLKARLKVEEAGLVSLIKKKALTHARSLKRMCQQLSESLGFQVSRHMLRAFLKKLGYSWKRFRKSLKRLQDELEYEQKLAELRQLVCLSKDGYIDLFFADESGFNLQGHVPYGWQPKGEYIQITPQKSGSTQVFGLMSADNRLQAYSCKGSMDSAAVIAFVDDFAAQMAQPTVVVLDNAPIHRSELFLGKMEEWRQQGLEIFFLPSYSPHLNLIEILWRKIKYEWLEYERISSQQQLELELERIINQFGQKYTINFKCEKVPNILV